MPLYNFSLDECGKRTPGQEPHELPGPAEARAEAVRAARDIMSSEVAEGRLCLGCRIEIEDLATGGVEIVRFRDVVTIIES